MLKWPNLLATCAGAFGTVGFQGIWDGEILAGVMLLVIGDRCGAASLLLDK